MFVYIVLALIMASPFVTMEEAIKESVVHESTEVALDERVEDGDGK